MSLPVTNEYSTDGGFLDFAGERYYVIRNVDKIAPFFISLVSDSDHWLFVSSTGGLTAGRVSPDTALLPYVTVDKIHESSSHSGCKTIIRVTSREGDRQWEPFNREHDRLYGLSRQLYKNVIGNKLCFEEINHDLKLRFRYTWAFSDQYGFVRQCELRNMGDSHVLVDMVDGLQNILPAGTPRFTQTNSSNLVDAYKWAELDEQTGLALFTLNSGITDRAEPCESLTANTVFCLGLDATKVLLSSGQLENFSSGQSLQQEHLKRGIRGAYLVNSKFELGPQKSQHWQLIANIEQSQCEVVDLSHQLLEPGRVASDLSVSIDSGSEALVRIMAAADGLQETAEEIVSAHHYANVLFNVLRGGIFDNQYIISRRDFKDTVETFNVKVYERHRQMLHALPEYLHLAQLLEIVEQQNDPQLFRLTREYLPITFGRRHGDPSRPWNQFSIKLKDTKGNRLLSYQGNWRDIFQNWEALAFSFPQYIENMVSKFLNASTMDGYNPYRITKQGIDWEVEDADDPWSYIGYWGDHQIIYALKLLELSRRFHPQQLTRLLRRSVFCYANVPYRIKPFAEILKNAKSTVVYDNELAEEIERRVARIGSDGKLLLDNNREVYQVNLLEKLLVPLLSKLGNFVVDGGIWMNTQRPEWNDANNALVGQGLSMVTLYYLRRYVSFLQQLLVEETEVILLSRNVNQWLLETSAALTRMRSHLSTCDMSSDLRYRALEELGLASSRYRERLYSGQIANGKVSQKVGAVRSMLDDTLAAIDHSIAANQRWDGLYHSYNLLDLKSGCLAIDTLYPMLEGQVAALSSGAIAPDQAVSLIASLFDSEFFRTDQNTFMLYPDRKLPGFLAKNRVDHDQVLAIPVLTHMLAQGDERIIMRDRAGCFRFNSGLTNIGDLHQRLALTVQDYGKDLGDSIPSILTLYESVFNHKSFTGRSGGMFGFEGLGSIYWHMVSKLLLAVQENFFLAKAQGFDENICGQLGQLYYRVRAGIGFNKTPAEYGAFPTDPYSHTPKHAGAQQPGMTGQVKEEVLTRFGELGVRVVGGAVQFEPDLLRSCEFIEQPQCFRYLDVAGCWQEITVPSAGMAFTWCQVPIVYRLDDAVAPSLSLLFGDGNKTSRRNLALCVEESEEVFMRTGAISQITLVVTSDMLFCG